MKLRYERNPKIINEDVDERIFKALLRTIKESGRFCDVKRRFKDFTSLMRSCYNSRDTHKSEGVYVNATYWPADCGIAPLRTGTWSLYMYYIRLINIYSEEEAKKVFRFLGMIKRLKDSAVTEKERRHLISDMEEIYTAFKKCDINEPVNAYMSKIRGMAYDIPF